MGWSSANYIFDPIMKALQDTHASDEMRKHVASILIKALQDGDWDTEDDSLEAFKDDPAIVAAFEEHDIFLFGSPGYRAKYGWDEDDQEQYDLYLERGWQ